MDIVGQHIMYALTDLSGKNQKDRSDIINALCF